MQICVAGGASYAVLSEVIWSFLHVVEDMRGEFKPDTTVGLLKRIARILSPSPPNIDKTTYDYWKTRLQGRNHVNIWDGGPERLALPFLKWSDAGSLPYMC